MINDSWRPVSIIDADSENVKKVFFDSIIPLANQNSVNPVKPDLIEKIRSSFFGDYYRDYLKKYRIIRYLWVQVFRRIYIPIRSSLFVLWHSRTIFLVFKKAPNRWRTLKSLAVWVSDNKEQAIKLVGEHKISTPKPIIFPEGDRGFLKPPHDEYIFPSIYVVKVINSFVTGGSNFVFTDKEAIYHDLYNFKLDSTSEELHGRHLINLRRMRMFLPSEDRLTVISIPKGASFLDACAPNYAHWLTEVLPRIAAFCSNTLFQDIPLIINDGLHKNILESIYALVGDDREILQLPIGCKLIVHELYVTSVAGYVPFERRTTKSPYFSHGLFSSKALSLIQQSVYRRLVPALNTGYPKKIYIRRNSGIRKVLNNYEVERVLVEKGYVVVEPEGLTFLEQVQLFRNAEFIVASSGAALANIIFSSANTRIVILIGKYANTSYWYWQNIACSVGCKITYVLGIPDSGGIHSDIMISVDDILKAVT